MLIDAAHPEETRVVTVKGSKVEEFDFEAAKRRQLRGNIYLAKVTRVEPSLQAAFRRVRWQPSRLPRLQRDPSRLLPDSDRRRMALLEEEARPSASTRSARASAREQDERRRRGRRRRRAEPAAARPDAVRSPPPPRGWSRRRASAPPPRPPRTSHDHETVAPDAEVAPRRDRGRGRARDGAGRPPTAGDRDAGRPRPSHADGDASSRGTELGPARAGVVARAWVDSPEVEADAPFAAEPVHGSAGIAPEQDAAAPRATPPCLSPSPPPGPSPTRRTRRGRGRRLRRGRRRGRAVGRRGFGRRRGGG